MLEEYLRHFVNARQNNWVQLLDVAQFCFNASTSSSTGRSPFEIVSGRQPVLPHLVNHPYVEKNLQAHNFMKEWRPGTHQITTRTDRVSRTQRPASYQKVRRPAEVLKKVRNTSYRVALPTWMKIYPVIHASNLKLYHQNTEDLQQNVVIRPIIDLSQKEVKDVEEILAKRVRKGRRLTRKIHEYLIKWKNLPVEETGWERVKI
ncbi:reverse transcriptase [Cucumis melo var. makuwa]|uniref:Reverse transcriptase n=1 Tax=Cucumis melo var. makuwa TaxID=1194695 RepID=A0A5D3BD64_CUCMM|nr:reverse transcriptase [Cucumis melo var. makuwa]